MLLGFAALLYVLTGILGVPDVITANAAASDWQLSESERADVAKILEDNPASEADSYYSVAPYFSQPT